MTNVTALKEMLKAMGTSAELDTALRIGALAVLDGMEPETVREQKPEPEEPKPQPEKLPEPQPKTTKRSKRPEFDLYKAANLYKQGWTLNQIAGEMGCSAQTVSNRLGKAGVK